MTTTRGTMHAEIRRLRQVIRTMRDDQLQEKIGLMKFMAGFNPSLADEVGKLADKWDTETKRITGE